MAKVSLEERKVRAMPVVKALPCGKVGLFVASTLVLLHRVLQESTGTGGLVVSKSLKLEAGLSQSPSVLPSLSPGSPSQLKSIHNGPPPWKGSCHR